MRRDTCVVREALRKWQVKTKMRRSDGDGQITAPPYHFPLLPKMSLLLLFFGRIPGGVLAPVLFRCDELPFNGPNSRRNACPQAVGRLMGPRSAALIIQPPARLDMTRRKSKYIGCGNDGCPQMFAQPTESRGCSGG